MSTKEVQQNPKYRRAQGQSARTTAHANRGSWPDSMTAAEFNSHPVRELLRNAAYFGKPAIPSEAELKELELPDEATHEIDLCARRLARIHDAGDHKAAWDQVDVDAAGILSELSPRDLEPASRRRGEPDPLADANPSELADHVLSQGYGSVAPPGHERIDTPRGNQGSLARDL